MVKFIVNELKILSKDVCYIAYTGKAAQVLKEKGCGNTMTAHKLLYNSYQNANGTFSHSPKKRLDYRYKLIVLDEVSMFPKEM